VDNFHVEVEMARGGSSWNSFSGGERSRVASILSLVIGDVAASRARAALSFLWVDEVLDPVDTNGSEAAMRLLSSVKDRYNSIYVVTHKSTLQELFTQKITVEKSGCFSKVLCDLNE
jgi:DNA repair exonuclease SbcCD ATPase subunit